MLNDALFYLFCLVNLFCFPRNITLHSGLWSSFWLGFGFVSYSFHVIKPASGRMAVWLNEIRLTWLKGTVTIICTLLILE
jgi:hypothetical protein